MRLKLSDEKRNAFVRKLTRTQYEALATWAKSALKERKLYLDGARIAFVSRLEMAVTAKEAQQVTRTICADLGIAMPKTGGWRLLPEACAETDFLLRGDA